MTEQQIKPTSELFRSQQNMFLSDRTKSRAWRLEQLNRLEKMLTENSQAIRTALSEDFKTSWMECDLEFNSVLATIAETREKLAQWMQPEEVALPSRFATSGYRGIIYREPYGVCLVVSPFNAPIALTFHPLITAISAGNTAIVKPSEATSKTTALYADLFGKYFETDSVALVTGGREVVEELLVLPFDFIFFTGSSRVGKVVMRAAAENLTPVLLELGGQNPAIVDSTADLKEAAEKLVWGAMAFAGQWCVSPGYVYVHESVADAFVTEAKAALERLYGPTPRTSPDFSRIVTEKDVVRLQAILAGATIVAGGEVDPTERYVAPTLVYPAQWSDPVMDGEIFGPILPILPYSDLNEVIATIKTKPKGLSVYVFSGDSSCVDRVMASISFGAGAVNETMLQCMMASYLPFGGVGPSGLGQYFGKYGFDSLSHLKSVVMAPKGSDFKLLLPPYTPEKAMELGGWFAP